MGVWIEIQELQCRLSLRKVTPLVGVWIEMFYTGECEKMAGVTPLVGVWIEITGIRECIGAACGHSPCGSVD